MMASLGISFAVPSQVAEDIERSRVIGSMELVCP